MKSVYGIFGVRLKIRLQIIVGCIIWSLLFSHVAYAGLVTFEKEYHYQASEFDSKASSRTLALEQIKKLLLEEIGTYLISETEVKNFQMTKDQITTFTAGIVRTEILDEKWDGTIYYLKAKIAADPGEVAKAVDSLRQDKQKSKELEESKKKTEELTNEVEKLKIALAEKSDDKKLRQYNEVVNKLGAIDWFNKGRALLFERENSNRFAEAIEALDRAIELDSSDPLAHYFRGLALLESNNNQKAVDDFTRAIDRETPDKIAGPWGTLQILRAKAYKNSGNYTAAFKDLEAAIQFAELPGNLSTWFLAKWEKYDFDEMIKKYPKDYRGYFCRGYYLDHVSHEDRRAALSDYKKAISLNPNHAKGFYFLGYAYRLNAKTADDVRKGISAYTKAIQLKPKNVQQMVNLYKARIDAYMQLSDYKQAIQDYDKVVELEPRQRGHYLDRGNYKSEMGNYRDAVNDFDKALLLPIQEYCYDEEIYYRRGNAYLEMKNYKLALEDYSKAIELRTPISKDYNKEQAADLFTSNLYVQRGRANAGLHKKQLAITDFDKAIELCPWNKETYFYRGYAYINLGEFQQAIADFSKLEELNPEFEGANSEGVYLYRGLAYHYNGDESMAINDFDKAIKLAPQNATAYSLRGQAYYNLGIYKQALMDFNQAIKFDPKGMSWSVYDGRGQTLLRLGEYKQAIKDFDHAVELNPTAIYSYYGRALCYYKLGNSKEVVYNCNVALKLGVTDWSIKASFEDVEDSAICFGK